METENDYTLLEEATARFMECVGLNEGTWMESQWHHFGITPEMAALLNAAWAKHFDHHGSPAKCSVGEAL